MKPCVQGGMGRNRLDVLGQNLKLERRQVSSREPPKTEIQCGRKAESLSSEQVKESSHWSQQQRRQRNGPLSFHPFFYQQESRPLQILLRIPVSTASSTYILLDGMCLLGGHVYSPLLRFPGGGISPESFWPLAVPFLISKEESSVWWKWERNPACTTQLLACPVLLGAAFPQRKDFCFCFCWKALPWGEAVV